MPSSTPSLRWLYLAVIGPLAALAALAWWGMQSQVQTAWADARTQAEGITEKSAIRIGDSLENFAVTAPNYPDPPVPGAPSEKDRVLDSTDVSLLLELRDDPDAGLSPAGLPRNALAALRLYAIDPDLQNPADLADILVERAPSVITATAIRHMRFPVGHAVSWTRSEEARHLIRLHPDQAAEGFWWRDGENLWWVQSAESTIRYITPDKVSSSLEQTPLAIPEWASLVLHKPQITPPPRSTGVLLASTPIPFGKDLSVSLFASPAIIEHNVRLQQRWVLSFLAAALITAVISLHIIHRTVARERHLAGLKSQFVASVSHELRAPLGSIRLMAEALQQERVSNPAEFHALIAREGARLSHLIENVLDFARIEDGRKSYHFEETDLTALIRETIQLMQPLAIERKVTIASRIPELTANIDPAAVQQALINLLDNALKFSAPGQTVTVAADCIRHAIAIRITDQGPGIPENEHQNIFERFHRLGNELRRETQGTGLGLSIVKHVAEAHNGSITVSSQPPDGATFTLTLPCAS